MQGQLYFCFYFHLLFSPAILFIFTLLYSKFYLSSNFLFECKVDALIVLLEYIDPRYYSLFFNCSVTLN